MATVVSHAMRRIATSPDANYSSCGLRSENSRIGWSQDSESALSRSMRYADPWLYDSVRAPNGLLLAPALVLCSCPDYHNGTKRSNKKGPTTCKKCKGTRLPLGSGDSKFGTMRCYPTAGLVQTPTRAGTVRVSSTSRPSILPTTDPYDLMRRSRLTVGENGTQGHFRARSVSPGKVRGEGRSVTTVSRPKGMSKYSTVGRKSILECHVNPYELMTSEPEPQDASITRLNGQRIRVRPANLEPDYEDVQLRKIPSYSSQTPKPQKTKPKPQQLQRPAPPPPRAEKESESNRFKSILKKPTAAFSDTDSSCYDPERSPSPAHKSGSHFYLPMPASTPRKKVQFLVENELVALENNNASSSSCEEEELEGRNRDERAIPGAEETRNLVNDDTGIPPAPSCKLKRSESDRALKEENGSKVVFHDSLALRGYRKDTRIVFTDKDLEKLDGMYTSKFGKLRPKEPPPQPPLKIEEVEEEVVPVKDSVKVQMRNGVDEKTQKKDLLNEMIQKLYELPPPAAPPRKRSNNKLPTLNGTGNVLNGSLSGGSTYSSPRTSPPQTPDVNDCYETMQITPNNDIYEDMPIVIATLDDSPNYSPDYYKTSPDKISIRTSFGDDSYMDYQITNGYDYSDKILIRNNYEDMQGESNRTILQISTPDPKTVHKLKIRNEFPETNNINTIAISDNNLGKTSIMINGDDCYSTIKVCDEIPLYHSSVVVKDTVNTEAARKSSTVYITGNFVSTFTDDSNEKSFETQDKPTTPTTPTIPEEIKQTDADTKEIQHEEFTTLDLLKCLSDPVEAVRRNLVPHVCGKSDPPIRPKRGEKASSHHDSKSQDSLSQIQALSEQDKVAKFIEESFVKLRNTNLMDLDDKDLSSEHSSSTQYEIMDQASDCYTDHSNRSSITEEELNARTKFYELLADSAIVEVSESEDHHYESIKINPDPIYEEIEIPPPLPSVPPPMSLLDDLQLDKEYTTRSIFEGASKYDILSYLVDAKERGIVPEDSYTYNFNNTDVAIEEEVKDKDDLPYNRVSHMSTVSDSSEDSSLVMSSSLTDDKIQRSEVERNDSGVGSETSKSSFSKYRAKNENTSCEDCESNLDLIQNEDEPLICRKCIKKRTERKEIITEIVETEEKYSRDLQIILEEFYQPMLVAGLLTSDQLSAIFLNVEELLENSQALAERLRDAVEIATEQGDEDLQTVNIGKLVIEAAPMLHAFETYCVRQGSASLLLASLEKEKELLRIFLRVSQMENTVLRRMNLNSFLMVPVQRVTKYPLLLARLYKVTPTHHESREQLKEAQHKIELHLNHMNSETKDVPSKLWRRISSIPTRRSSSEMDLVNIKLRKIAVDVLEWNHDEAKFALEGRLLYTQPTDNNWRKGRTIKLTPVNALLVTNGKSTAAARTDPADESLVFSRQAGVRDAALLLVRDKNGRYSLLREPLYLDRCVIAADPAWQSYFEVQELLGKDTFIFKAEDEDQTKIWYRQLQYYAQGMGAWRKRRNALANIMINGMGLRS